MPPRQAPTGKSVAKVAKPSEQALAIHNQRMGFLAEHAGAGTENVGLRDVIMPRFKLLQQLSPEVQRRRPEYIEGAEAGMIINVATQRLYSSIDVVPAAYIHHYVEWRPNRGGFVADHGDKPQVMDAVVRRDDKNFDILRNGNIIIPTPTWYVIVVGGVDARTGQYVEESLDPGIIPMPRTMSKGSKSWMSRATNEKAEHPEHGKFQVPLFYRSWTLEPFERTDENNSWFVWVAKAGPSVVQTVAEGDDRYIEGAAPEEQPLVLPDDTMQRAIRFRDMVQSGQVRATADHFADEDQGVGGSNGGAEQRGGDERPM